MLARSYLRASTNEQDASRARAAVEAFAAEHGLHIVGTYTENESGAKLARPELFRLIADSRPGDVLLIEQVDRLSRLNDTDLAEAARRARCEANPSGGARSPDLMVARRSGRQLHWAHVRRDQRHDARRVGRRGAQGL